LSPLDLFYECECFFLEVFQALQGGDDHSDLHRHLKLLPPLVEVDLGRMKMSKSKTHGGQYEETLLEDLEKTA
jgi:hypothetical protein